MVEGQTQEVDDSFEGYTPSNSWVEGQAQEEDDFSEEGWKEVEITDDSLVKGQAQEVDDSSEEGWEEVEITDDSWVEGQAQEADCADSNSSREGQLEEGGPELPYSIDFPPLKVRGWEIDCIGGMEVRGQFASDIVEVSLETVTEISSDSEVQVRPRRVGKKRVRLLSSSQSSYADNESTHSNSDAAGVKTRRLKTTFVFPSISLRGK